MVPHCNPSYLIRNHCGRERQYFLAEVFGWMWLIRVMPHDWVPAALVALGHLSSNFLKNSLKHASNAFRYLPSCRFFRCSRE
jgi:hypothetical protein